MNTYIKMEIKARELGGRLLLALAAAERGHSVLLGDVLPLMKRSNLVPPGIFHDTSLYPDHGQVARRAAMLANGFRITSQDEEHGLLEPTFDNYAVKRYSARTLAQADAVMAWGPHDGDALREHYPNFAERIQDVGSPRFDLYRPEFAPYFRARSRPGIGPDQRYVLFASNFTRVIGVNPFHVFVRNMRKAYFEGEDDPFEVLQYEEASAQLDYLPHTVRAIRLLACANPDAVVVVRPHPQERPDAWQDLLGPIPNVLISRHGDIGRWIRGASAVVHSGDTSGFEATLAEVPVISFVPLGGDHHWSDRFTNRLGWRADSADQLVELASAALHGQLGVDGTRDADAKLLTERVAHSDARFAADAIVDLWEELRRGLPDGATLSASDFERATRRRRAQVATRRRLRPIARVIRRVAGQVRGSGPGSEQLPFLTAQKFPPIRRSELAEIVEGYRSTLDRFHDVNIKQLSPWLILLGKGRRG